MTQEFVTLPREVVEQAMNSLRLGVAMYPNGGTAGLTINEAINALRAALDQPKNHVPDAGNMVTAGWKLVPVEPTDDMLYDIQEFSHILPPRGKRIWAQMLAAAPQPPTTEDSSVVQPQDNQPAMTPIAQRKLNSLLTEGYTISGYSVYHEQKHQHGFVTGAGLVGWWRPEGVEHPQPQGEQEPVAEIQVKNGHWIDTPVARTAHLVDGVYKLYTHPQPKRDPLTDRKIVELDEQALKDVRTVRPRQGYCELFARAIEAAHNIK